jgi:hypothetical protein
MLYDLYAFSIFSAPLDPMWGGNVFNAENNINGITANTNDDGWGGRIFYCAFIRNPQSTKEFCHESYRHCQ